MAKKKSRSKSRRPKHSVQWGGPEAQQDFEKHQAQTAAERARDKQTGPTVERLKRAMLDFLKPLEVHRRDRARNMVERTRSEVYDETAQLQAELESAIADQADSPVPAYGATIADVIFAMQQMFKGLPAEVIEDAAKELLRTKAVYTSKGASWGDPAMIWRVTT